MFYSFHPVPLSQVEPGSTFGRHNWGGLLRDLMRERPAMLQDGPHNMELLDQHVQRAEVENPPPHPPTTRTCPIYHLQETFFLPEERSDGNACVSGNQLRTHPIGQVF